MCVGQCYQYFELRAEYRPENTSYSLFSFCDLIKDSIVTDQVSVFKSRTRRTEDDKLSWSFGWLNCESRSLGYIAQRHCHARQALVWDRATVQF
jgi:hypothetical protein